MSSTMSKKNVLKKDANTKTTKPIEPSATSYSQDSAPIRIKVLTIGNTKVGKSCIVKKYCEKNRFVSNYNATIGVDYGVKSVSRTMDDGSNLNIKVDFFDLSGDPNYLEVRNEFYTGVDAVLVIFDVTDKQSFESLSRWMKEAKQYGVASESTTLIVVGNKIDQLGRSVSEQQGISFASENNAIYFETSAQTGASVDDLFDYLLRETCKHGYYS